jgi:hypothetical protein
VYVYRDGQSLGSQFTCPYSGFSSASASIVARDTNAKSFCSILALRARKASAAARCEFSLGASCACLGGGVLQVPEGRVHLLASDLRTPATRSTQSSVSLPSVFRHAFLPKGVSGVHARPTGPARPPRDFRTSHWRPATPEPVPGTSAHARRRKTRPGSQSPSGSIAWSTEAALCALAATATPATDPALCLDALGNLPRQL